ncbi:MAG: L-threonylcarbamoyladenylate synthase [Dokdonella sp.]
MTTSKPHGGEATADAGAAQWMADAGLAAQVLDRGGLIALPTETVYGLGADAGNAQAVARIFATKQRPADHPLIVHIRFVSQLTDWARHIPPVAWTLADAFWPGPLTLILRRAPGVLDAVTGGLDTVALRIPDHALALSVLEQFGRGIAAPSANRYGRVSPTSAAHVREEFGDALDLLLDGGPCAMGIESTIVDLSAGEIRVLRPGAITDEDLHRVSGMPIINPTQAGVGCPGAKDSHYAPKAKVVMTTAEAAAQEVQQWRTRGCAVGLLASERPPNIAESTAWLRLGAHAAEQARELYGRLREADHLGLDVVVAVAPEDAGLGRALRDRLYRAAGLGDARILANVTARAEA